MPASPVLEAVLKRDRLVVVAALAALTLLSWLYLVDMARDMGSMSACCVPQGRAWQAGDLVALFLMWAVMMVGMMVPTAAPMILLFATLSRRRAERGGPYVPTATFVAGYLAAWTGFSLVATLVQWGLHEKALLSPMMVGTSQVLGGGLLLATGLFQWTPLKRACLLRCRSPLDFLMTEWREGSRGAWTMGLRHGIFCVGCCWFLMGLLFVAGVMNLLWVAAITAYVLAEKVLPFGERLGTATGWLLAFGGAALMGHALWA